MARLSLFMLREQAPLRHRVREALQGSRYLQEAAESCLDLLWNEFEESLVLARVFGNVQLSDLPADDQAFVRDVASERSVLEELDDRTQVLSLLATRGVEPEWNDRRQSRRHRGIPLVSASFVKTVPMVSRMMADTGIGLDWIEKQKSQIVIRFMGSMARLFYVEDARTACYEDGLKIVSAQDFVTRHGIQTVFGFGGSYLTGSFVAFIFFCREGIPEAGVENFMPLVNTFKTATLSMVMEGRYFGP